jgi:hypothetical protein
MSIATEPRPDARSDVGPSNCSCTAPRRATIVMTTSPRDAASAEVVATSAPIFLARAVARSGVRL